MNAVKRETQPDSQLACSYGNSISFDGVNLNTFHLRYVLFFGTSMNKVTPKESIDWIFCGSAIVIGNRTKDNTEAVNYYLADFFR